MHLVLAIKSLEVPGGGAERVLVELANGLVARGYSITIVTFDRKDAPSFYPLSAAVRRIDLDVGPPGQPTPRLRLGAALRQLRRSIRAAKPDLVVGFMHSMYVPLGAALLGSGLTLIASEHIGFDHYRNRPLQRTFVRAADALFAWKTVPTDAIKREYSLGAQSKIVAIANPLGFEAADPSVKRTASVAGGLLLAVGRFMSQKNHLELIEAFARIANRHPGWRLRLVGEGDLRGVVESRIRALQLDDRVHLPGAQKDMASEYEQADIVVVPSLYESFGLVTAEALACGRPVIGFSECPGTNELIVDGVNGLLVTRQGDPVANLADAMSQLMSDAALRDRLGAAGPDSVKKFSRVEVLNAWQAFFEKAGPATRRHDSR